jgi:hypothetical protein
VSDLDVVVALEVHRDPGWPEVVVLAQVDDLAHDLGAGGLGADLGAVGAVPEPVQAVGVIAPTPGVEALAADTVVAAGQADVAGDLLSVAQDGQASLGHPEQLLLGHGVSSLVGDPKCQPSPSVPYVPAMMAVRTFSTSSRPASGRPPAALGRQPLRLSGVG